jgi:hypothetical protein
MCSFGDQKKEGDRWPKIRNAYYRAGERARLERIEYKKSKNIIFNSSFKDFKEEWEWWISGKSIDNPDQMVMFE